MSFTPLPYPVIWEDAKGCARLFGMGESTFLAHVAAGRLPEGNKIGGKRLWRVPDVDEALVKLGSGDTDDPVMQRIGRAG